MSTKMNPGLSIDEVSDTFAPDVAGKQEALEIVRPLGVKRARFVSKNTPHGKNNTLFGKIAFYYGVMKRCDYG